MVFKTSKLCLLIVIESANFGFLSAFFPISRNKFKSFESEIGGKYDFRGFLKINSKRGRLYFFFECTQNLHHILKAYFANRGMRIHLYNLLYSHI